MARVSYVQMANTTPVILAMGLCVSACEVPGEQVSFALRLETGQEQSMPRIVASAAQQLQMQTDSQTSDFGGRVGNMKAYLLSGHGIRAVIQTASVEECEIREGPRDPEFSTTLHNVHVFATSPFATAGRMEEVVRAIKNAAHREGATILAESDKCRTSQSS
jgi:hypothetical protein